MQKLNHKNIIKVHEYLENEVSVIIIMEYVEGIPLSHLKYKNITGILHFYKIYYNTMDIYFILNYIVKSIEK